MSEKAFYITTATFLTIVLSIIGIVLYKENNNYDVWLNQCIQKGGIPSKYEVIQEKNTKKEYLCIKPESIIQ